MNANQLAKLVREAAADADTIRDDESPLHLRRQGKQWRWSVRYRTTNGVRRRVSLGTYPRVSLAKARSAASKVLRAADVGGDPQGERKAAKVAAARAKQDSIDVLIDRYVAEWAKPRKKSWRKDDQRLRNEVLPKWRGRPISSITRQDVRDLIGDIAARPAQILANRVLEVTRKMLNWALSQDLITANPAAMITPVGVERRNRPDEDESEGAYSVEEVRRIWQNCQALDAATRGPVIVQLYTAARPAESYDIEWSEIDLASGWWTLPASRSKNRRAHRIPMLPGALKAIKAIERTKIHVFAGARGNKQRTSSNKLIFRGVSTRLKPRHALRSTAASGMAASGVSSEDVSRVLNHVTGKQQTTGYIDYTYDREKHAALTRWAEWLEEIIGANQRPRRRPRRQSGTTPAASTI